MALPHWSRPSITSSPPGRRRHLGAGLGTALPAAAAMLGAAALLVRPAAGPAAAAVSDPASA
ncbi:MAG: hypothetical protein ACRDNT_28790, partial [Streptosporangiaceae bacterium]